MKKQAIAAVALSGVVLSAAPAWAQLKPGVELSGSGFLTIGAGKMIGGTRQFVGDYDCPCFVADYAQAGVYDGRSNWQFKPDTKLGVQGSAAFDNRRFSITAQAVARGARDGRVNLEWLYGSYKLTDDVTVQVGRKRLPMFYYSDTQDIGFALPWTHLPPQLYGWEAVNYNGVNVSMQKQLGDWSAILNVLAGSEKRTDSGYWKIYSGRRSRTDIRWDAISGGDLTLQKDWLETRFVFIQSHTRTRNRTGIWDYSLADYDPATEDGEFTVAARQRIHGVAVNIDYNDWIGRSEYIHINRPGMNFKDFASVIAGGRRFGKWQLMLTHSRYWGKAVSDQGGDPDGLEAHRTNSVTVRYDLTTSSAIKVQLDSQHDYSKPNWGIATDPMSATGVGPNYGNARLLSVSYDMVF